MSRTSDSPQPQGIPNHPVLLTDGGEEAKHDGYRHGKLFGDVEAVHGSNELTDRRGREQHIKHVKFRQYLREDRRQGTGDDAENRRIQLTEQHW